jgi:hypothetical protein
MLIGLQGKMGAGKTLSMSVLTSYFSAHTGAPLYANYNLQGAAPLESIRQLWQLDTAVVAFDELHVNIDSRNWKNNVFLTHFITQTRKKKLAFFYTTQHIGQVDLRVRQNTDILIHCEKRNGQIWLSFIDYQYKQLGRRYLLENPSRFYNLYNTFELIFPLRAK